MIDTSYWILFFGAAIALNLAPGPDLVYIVSRTLAQGPRIGLASAAGVCTGAFVHVLAAAFGLSAVLATSATAFTVIQYAGAAYLLYLGVQALRSRGTNFAAAGEAVPAVTIGRAFRQGVLVDLLNPKVAIFFMAFLPQFVRPGHGSTSLQLVLLGALVIVVAMVVEALFVFGAARASAVLRRRRQASVWLDRAFGSVLVALGLRLALAEPVR